MKFDNIIKIGLVLSPVFFISWLYPNIILSNRQQYQIFFQFFIVIALALSIKNKWFGTILFLAVVDIFRQSFNSFSASYLSGIIWAALWFFLITNYIKKNEIESILKTVAVMAVVMAGFIALQIAGLWPLKIGSYVIGAAIDCYGNIVKPNWWLTGFPGIIGQQNILGAYLGICMPLFLVYGKIKKISILLPIMLLYLVFVRNTMGVITAMAGIMFFEIFRTNRSWKRILFWCCLNSIGVILFLKFIRLPDWLSRMNAFKVIMTWGCWFGNGLGSFARLKIMLPCNGGWQVQAHNEWAQIYHELGWIALALVTWYSLYTLKKFSKIREKPDWQVVLFACFFGLLINCFGNFTFHHAVTAFLGIILIALVDISLTKNKEGRQCGHGLQV